ncbi:EsaB/YukD family protein [Lentzea sp. NPDC004789]
MTGQTRVTLIGARRRLDVVVPSAEPLGVLLPEFLHMTGEPRGTPPGGYRLVTTDGTTLAPDRSLDDAEVSDGAMVRLLRREDAPSDPVVHDVADAVTDDLGKRPWRWNDTAKRWSRMVPCRGSPAPRSGCG